MAGAELLFVLHERYRLRPWARTLEMSPRRVGTIGEETTGKSCHEQRSRKNINGHCLVSLRTFTIWRV